MDLKALICLCVIVAFVIGSCTDIGKDDTDPPGTGNRSGMELRTDNKTGCQYLGAPGFLGLGGGGSLIPRVDASGKHICTKG